jgi:hypothetical protein
MLLEANDSDPLGKDTTESYLRAISELNGRLGQSDVSDELRPEIARTFYFPLRNIGWDSVRTSDPERAKIVAEALSARLALIERLIAAAPDRTDLKSAAGTTHFWIGVRNRDDGDRASSAAHMTSAVKQLRDAVTSSEGQARADSLPKLRTPTATESRSAAHSPNFLTATKLLFRYKSSLPTLAIL